MFKRTKLRLIGKDGDFEVFNRISGELVGAIIREAGTERDWENSGGGLPYLVYYQGNHIATVMVLPLAQKIIDDLLKES